LVKIYINRANRLDIMSNGQYLGHVRKDDPLYGYLRHEIQPQTGRTPERATYRVFRLNASNDVFLYEEKYSGVKFIGKFFRCNRTKDADKAAARLTHEFENLQAMRGCGLTGAPHLVARPLGKNYALNALLVTESCDGELLSKVILAAIHNGEEEKLYQRLTALAYFFSCLHNRTANDRNVDFQTSCDYTERLIEKLLRINGIKEKEADELRWLRDQWFQQQRMWEDRQVLVHGENFKFTGGLNVSTFDLERAHRDDRVFDVGRIAGELKHFFLRDTGRRETAEPFIGHFLWEYACHFPDRDRAFQAITARVPFYMGITLLRIARNNWIAQDYRRRLISEAKECLRRFA
jgi:hypothetical protein